MARRPTVSASGGPAPATRKALGLAIRKLRKAADLTQETAADRMGVSVQSWRRYEWGQRDLSFENLKVLSSALGATREQLLEAEAAIRGARGGVALALAGVVIPASPPAETAMVMLPIRDRVQAGAWLAADDSIQDGQRYPALRDPRYPHAEQWLSVVVGDSVNRLNIFDGDLVHCVDAIAIGYHPTTGDVVEVERLRFGGQERELSLKQVEVTPEGVELWPRSTNERWQTPLAFTDGAQDGEEIDVRIRARVVAAIRRF